MGKVSSCFIVGWFFEVYAVFSLTIVRARVGWMSGCSWAAHRLVVWGSAACKLVSICLGERRDSNPRPLVPQTSALTPELQSPLYGVLNKKMYQVLNMWAQLERMDAMIAPGIAGSRS